MKSEILRFALVGIAALLVHFLSFSLIFAPMGMPILIANVAAFLTAFQVSYWGHRSVTFRKSKASPSQSRNRFFLVALGGFLLNESLYATLLRYTDIDHRIALLFVLFVVAGATFVTARSWAFYAK
jgi:putative flippase GtrA